MGNHGFLHLPTATTPKAVDRQIRDIVSRRFGNALVVQSFPRGEDYIATWAISHAASACPSAEFYLTTPRLIETRHPMNDWMFWVEDYVLNNLGQMHAGVISDEGTGDEKWRPDPSRYPTYKAWLKAKCTGSPPIKTVLKAIAMAAYALLPPETRALDRIGANPSKKKGDK